MPQYNVAHSNAVEETVEEVAEKVTIEEESMEGKKWQCVVHGCIVEHGNPLTCTCCNDCQGMVYGSSDEDYEDLDDQWDPP